MLNLEEINNTIDQLEEGNTTFDNCIKLSALYIVRDKLQSALQSEIVEEPEVVDAIENELSDILPQYRKYC